MHDHLKNVVNLTHSVACVESGNGDGIAACDCVAAVWFLFCQLLSSSAWAVLEERAPRATLNEHVRSRRMKQQRKSIILDIPPEVMAYDRAIARQAGTCKFGGQKLSQACKPTCTYDMCAPTLARRVCSVGCRSHMRLLSVIQSSTAWVWGSRKPWVLYVLGDLSVNHRGTAAERGFEGGTGSCKHAVSV